MTGQHHIDFQGLLSVISKLGNLTICKDTRFNACCRSIYLTKKSIYFCGFGLSFVPF